MQTMLLLLWFICHSIWYTSSSMIWFPLHFTQNSWDILHLITDPASGHDIAGDLYIDADQVLALGIDNHDDQSVTMSESVAAGSTSAAYEDPRSRRVLIIKVNLFQSTKHQPQPCSFYNQHDDNRQSAARTYKRTQCVKLAHWPALPICTKLLW